MANLDADAAIDGLIVRVYPLDAQGLIVPVRGTLEFTLAGRRNDVAPRPDARVAGPMDTAASAGRLRPVRGPLPVAIPRHPSRARRKIAPEGSIHARLSLPGQGTFEATQSTVNLPPTCPPLATSSNNPPAAATSGSSTPRGCSDVFNDSDIGRTPADWNETQEHNTAPPDLPLLRTMIPKRLPVTASITVPTWFATLRFTNTSPSLVITHTRIESQSGRHR